MKRERDAQEERFPFSFFFFFVIPDTSTASLHARALTAFEVTQTKERQVGILSLLGKRAHLQLYMYIHTLQNATLLIIKKDIFAFSFFLFRNYFYQCFFFPTDVSWSLNLRISFA